MNEKLDLSALRSAINSLAEAVATVENHAWFQDQSPAVRNVIVAGVIQNFEFAYELAVKMIRRQLEIEAASPAEVDESSFRGVLRSAAERGLIQDVEAWFAYRQMRNATSHTYNQEKALEIWKGVPGFLQESRVLLSRLESRDA